MKQPLQFNYINGNLELSDLSNVIQIDLYNFIGQKINSDKVLSEKIIIKTNMQSGFLRLIYKDGYQKTIKF